MIKSILLTAIIILVGCGQIEESANASGTNIQDIGFSYYKKIGTHDEEIECAPYETAISVGCDCGIGRIQVQKVQNNKGQCICDGYFEVEASLICANIEY